MLKLILAVISSALLLQSAGQQPPGGKGAPATPPPTTPPGQQPAGKAAPKPAAAPFYEDTIVTRDKKEYKGRIHDYRDFVVVEQADAKRFTFRRVDIERTEFAPRFIRFPEIAPFPEESLTEKTGYDILGAGSTILCLPKNNGKSLVAIDVRTGKKLWDKAFEGRACEPVVAGGMVYLVGTTSHKDDTQKVKIRDAQVSKDVHRIRFMAVSLDDGSTVWDETYENSEKNEFWEFSDKDPAIYATPLRVYLFIKLRFYPIEKGNIVKEKEKVAVRLYTFDTSRKEKPLIGNPLKSEDLVLAYMGTPYEDSMLYETLSQKGGNTLVAVSLANGKKLWEAEPYLGKLARIMGDTAYIADGTSLHAYALKARGVKVKGWSVAYEGEEIAAFDANYVYVNRKKAQPNEFMGFSLKTGKKDISIKVPDGDRFMYLMHIGHRLLYTDSKNTIWCYDALKLSGMWKWGRPEGGAVVGQPHMMGSVLTMLKDGGINQVDVNTGRPLWQFRGAHTTVQPVGEFGMVARLITGKLEILRERKPPEGARFFTPMGTPLSFTTPEDEWSPPAIAPDRLYTLSLTGLLYAFDLKGEQHWSLRIAAAVRRPFAVSLLPDGRVAVREGTEAHIIDPIEKKKLFGMRDATFTRIDRMQFPVEKNIVMIADRQVRSLDPAKNGEAAWDSAALGVRDLVVADNRAYALTELDGIHVLDLRTGETQSKLVAPPRSSGIVVHGTRIVVQSGPFSIGEPSLEETKFTPRFATKEQNQGVQMLTAGSAVMAAGNVIFSNADKKVLAFDLATWKEAWAFDAPEYTSPLYVQGDRVYFSAPGRGLFGLNVKTGAVEWKSELADAALFTPIPFEGKIAFWASSGWIVTPK